jgi:hypothetical protein
LLVDVIKVPVDWQYGNGSARILVSARETIHEKLQGTITLKMMERSEESWRKSSREEEGKVHRRAFAFQLPVGLIQTVPKVVRHGGAE